MSPQCYLRSCAVTKHGINMNASTNARQEHSKQSSRNVLFWETEVQLFVSWSTLTLRNMTYDNQNWNRSYDIGVCCLSWQLCWKGRQWKQIMKIMYNGMDDFFGFQDFSLFFSCKNIPTFLTWLSKIDVHDWWNYRQVTLPEALGSELWWQGADEMWPCLDNIKVSIFLSRPTAYETSMQSIQALLHLYMTDRFNGDFVCVFLVVVVSVVGWGVGVVID